MERVLSLMVASRNSFVYVQTLVRRPVRVYQRRCQHRPSFRLLQALIPAHFPPQVGVLCPQTRQVHRLPAIATARVLQVHHRRRRLHMPPHQKRKDHRIHLGLSKRGKSESTLPTTKTTTTHVTTLRLDQSLKWKKALQNFHPMYQEPYHLFSLAHENAVKQIEATIPDQSGILNSLKQIIAKWSNKQPEIAMGVKLLISSNHCTPQTTGSIDTHTIESFIDTYKPGFAELLGIIYVILKRNQEDLLTDILETLIAKRGTPPHAKFVRSMLYLFNDWMEFRHRFQ